MSQKVQFEPKIANLDTDLSIKERSFVIFSHGPHSLESMSENRGSPKSCSAILKTRKQWTDNIPKVNLSGNNTILILCNRQWSFVHFFYLAENAKDVERTFTLFFRLFTNFFHFLTVFFGHIRLIVHATVTISVIVARSEKVWKSSKPRSCSTWCPLPPSPPCPCRCSRSRRPSNVRFLCLV